MSFSVMAHPARAAMVDDMSVDFPVAWDDGGGVWDTAIRAWDLYDRSALWHVVIQDDAILCDDFVRRVEDFLNKESPEYPVSFYLGGGRPRQAEVHRILAEQDQDDGRVLLPWCLWGVAICLPTAHIAGVMDECDFFGPPQYDRRISGYYERRNINTVYSFPSLADHRDDVSLIHSSVGVDRRALWFIDGS